MSFSNRTNTLEYHENRGRMLYTLNSHLLTLKAPTTSHYRNVFEASMIKSVVPGQTVPASILIWDPHCLYTNENQ